MIFVRKKRFIEFKNINSHKENIFINLEFVKSISIYSIDTNIREIKITYDDNTVTKLSSSLNEREYKKLRRRILRAKW